MIYLLTLIPTFKWWVSHVLNKRDGIIAKVDSHYPKRTHKFGFKVPKTVKDALRIYEEHGDDRWAIINYSQYITQRR